MFISYFLCDSILSKISLHLFFFLHLIFSLYNSFTVSFHVNVLLFYKVIIQTEMRNYTVKDYDALFQDIGFQLGSKIMRKSLHAWSDTPPKIPIYCFHGAGKRTPGVLYYGPGEFPDDQPYVKHDDGDGTVNIRSLRGCERWKMSGKYQVKHVEYPDAEHNGILGDDRMIGDVFDIIKSLIKYNQF